MDRYEHMHRPSLEEEFINSVTGIVEGEPISKYFDQQIAIVNPDLSQADLVAATGSNNINFINIGIIGYGNKGNTKDYYINFIEHTNEYILCTSFMLDENKFGCITDGSFRDREAEKYKNRELSLVRELTGEQGIKMKIRHNTNADEAEEVFRHIETGVVTAPEDPDRFKAVIRLLNEIIEKDPLVN